MNPFEVHVLGVGDTFSEYNAPSSLLLLQGGFHLAIDCPDIYARVLREASKGAIEVRQIHDVLLTHVHGDHMNGLEGLGFSKHFKEGKRLRLHASPEVLDALWEQRLKISMGSLWTGTREQNMQFEDYFEAHFLDWQGVNQIGPFQVELKRTRHHVTTSALKISSQGRTLGDSSDTSFDPALLEWLSEADLIIHETNLGPAHTPLSALLALPELLRSKLRLIHYQDGLETQTLPIRALRAGDVLAL